MKHRAIKPIYLIIPVVLLMLTVSYMIISRTMLEEEEEKLSLCSDLYASKLDSWIGAVKSEISVYKDVIPDICKTEDDIRKYLSLTYGKNAAYPEGLYIGSSDGTFIDSAGWQPPDDFRPEERPWYQNGIHSDDLTFCVPYLDARLQKPCVSISGKLDGILPDAVIAADLFLDYATSVVREMAEMNNIDGALLVTSDEMFIISSSYSTEFIGAKLSDFNDTAQTVQRIEDGRTDSFLGKRKNGRQFYVSISRLKNTDWYLVSYMKRETVLNPLFRTFAMTGLVVIIALLLLYLLSKKAVNQIVITTEESSTRKQINEAIARSYIAVAYINIKKDTYEEVLFSDFVRQSLGRSGNAREALATTVEQMMNEVYIPKMKAFVTLDTIADRLKNKGHISMEFLGKYSGFCRATFIPVELDKEGTPLTVLYLVRKIEGEILSLRDRLHVEETLVECIRTLSANDDLDAAIQHLLTIICQYHDADRAYIFDVREAEGVVANTYEYCKPGIPRELENLQKVPLDHLSRWFELFDKTGHVQINNLGSELPQDSPEYQDLVAQGIESLFAVPFLSSEGRVVGFLGVDNPRVNVETDILLKSVSSFIQEEFLKKRYRDELYRLSYIDQLTNVKNRHAYNDTLNRLNEQHAKNVGVIFADVNGLKLGNDKYGHEYGDRMLLTAANILRDIYHDSGESIYRIGGDEFVVFSVGTEKSVFEQKLATLLGSLGEIPLLSVGEVWVLECEDIEEQIKAADSQMYESKREYYRMMQKDHPSCQ